MKSQSYVPVSTGFISVLKTRLPTPSASLESMVDPSMGVLGLITVIGEKLSASRSLFEILPCILYGSSFCV
jgi:hypothetical protein